MNNNQALTFDFDATVSIKYMMQLKYRVEKNKLI